MLLIHRHNSSAFPPGRQVEDMKSDLAGIDIFLEFALALRGIVFRRNHCRFRFTVLEVFHLRMYVGMHVEVNALV
jgi:hypothetical protein